MPLIIIIVIHLSASLIPFADSQTDRKLTQASFQHWPAQFEGLPLHRLPMSDKELGFSQNFPGKIARFSDGSREIIFRYVDRLSRKVHPSADCLRGAGFTIEPQAIRRDQDDQLWGCVLANKDNDSYRVCERIYDQSGNSWYDVSSWFWSVLLNNSQGTWWAVTVAERV